jgi:TPR repeat protein
METEKPAFQKKLEKFFSLKPRKDGEANPIEELRYAAENGDQTAKWRLGKMYQLGEGVERNPAEAFKLFKQIVDNYTDARPGTLDWQLTANAMVALGSYYRDGVVEAGIAPDDAEARIMFTTAAHYFGHPNAQFELARMYLQAGDVGDNGIRAARMLKMAADRGLVGAQALLGSMLFDGRHVPRDTLRGLALLMGAVERSVGTSDADWISELQEEAFANATEEERRGAVELLKNGNLGLAPQAANGFHKAGDEGAGLAN